MLHKISNCPFWVLKLELKVFVKLETVKSAEASFGYFKISLLFKFIWIKEKSLKSFNTDFRFDKEFSDI